MGSTVQSIKNELKQAGNRERARHSVLFFKTRKGEYAEDDKFLGCTVPSQRKIAKHYSKQATFNDLKQLLYSPWHENRLTALFILVDQYKRGDEAQKSKIAKLYIANTKYINNWDLVDSSAPYILGDYLLTRNRAMLYRFAKSNSLWQKRIAILSTLNFIRHGEYEDTLNLAELLLNDGHDLIHKAVGWMLREVGNKSLDTEEAFLKKYYKTMPRTMLRYAIEKFPKAKYNFYLGRSDGS